MSKKTEDQRLAKQITQLAKGTTENDAWFDERTLVGYEFAVQPDEIRDHDDVPDLGRGYDHLSFSLQKIRGLLMFGPIPFDAASRCSWRHIVDRARVMPRAGEAFLFIVGPLNAAAIKA